MTSNLKKEPTLPKKSFTPEQVVMKLFEIEALTERAHHLIREGSQSHFNS